MTPHEIYKVKMEELENERIFDCADVKEYSTKTTIAVLEAVREKIEGMKKSEGGEWDVGVDDGEGYDEAVPYNIALSDLSTFITQEIKKIK